MSDRPSKVQRWLDLIAFLLTRRMPVGIDAIREHVPAYGALAEEADADSIRRKFERDKRELRELGIPIETVGEGYRLVGRELEMPVLHLLGEGGPPDHRAVELTAAELRELADALRLVAELPAFPYEAEAYSALRKLAFDHPEVLREAPAVRVARPEQEDLSTSTLRAVAEAVLARRRLDIRYHSIGRDVESDRAVDPYGVLLQHGHWYLVARDVRSDGRRVFRVDRMREVRPAPGKPPHFEVPVDFDLRSHAARPAWELGEGPATEARVRFTGSARERAGRAGWGEPLAGSDDVRIFHVRREDAFLRWLLSRAGEGQLLSPPELIEGYRRLVARTAALYTEGVPA